ncbi:hydroxyacid dehydrogenase [Aerosakkonemataceae cyanobacterium BLCC-F50]|uniref:Hydroxyacid dehydrogenase n=1 Tax=Floridaenema flaviceps BLCC-F50 TaxID=3153642 RepID=A0ABV4XIN2_9CYAN
MQKKVLVCSTIHLAGVEELRKCALVDEKTGLSLAELREVMPDYDAVVLRSGTNLTAEMLEAGKRGNLKIIGLAQTGTDNVDMKAAERLGIEVVNSTANAISTAELTFCLIFSLARQIIAAQQALLDGQWNQRNTNLMGIQLCGKTLGIIGLGNIGLMVAERAKAFGMVIVAYNRPSDRVAKIAEEKGYILCSLDELLEKSDIITLHLPLTDETKNLIDGKAIAKMKRTALIINCARGGIVNEADLLKALESDRIKGSALDVFEKEPLPKDSPLIEFAKRSNKLYLSPHLGSGTEEAQRQVAVEVAQKVWKFIMP